MGAGGGKLSGVGRSLEAAICLAVEGEVKELLRMDYVCDIGREKLIRRYLQL